MKGEFAAFVSYSHRDDEYDEGAITQLAKRLGVALRAITGRTDLSVFFDRETIEWGDAWRARIAQGLQSATALIAVVTPNYLNSNECRQEFEDFYRQEEHNRWFLPLYYIEVDDLETRDDPLCEAIRAHQRFDWRELRRAGPASKKVRQVIEDLAKHIRDLLREDRKADDPVFASSSEERSRAYRAHSAVEDDEADLLDALIQGRAAFEAGEYGLARALLLGALDDFGDDPDLLVELATVDWYDGALDEAESEFLEALDNGADRIEVLHGLGQVRVELGLLEEGVKDLTEVIDHYPDEIPRAYAQSTRALGLAGLGDFAMALEELAEAERITPNNSFLHFNRATILDRRHDPAAGPSYVRALICDDPPLSRPKRDYAQVRVRELGIVV